MQLLESSLGGNCKTAVLMCFSPFEDPITTDALFQLAELLKKIKNFPILNDEYAQVAKQFVSCIAYCLYIMRIACLCESSAVDKSLLSQVLVF